MSPKIRDENYRVIIPERVKEMAVKRNVKMKDLAESVNTVYENFQRQVKKGIIRKEWLDEICDQLNISEKYLTGESDRKGHRINDYHKPDKLKKILKEFMLYSGHEHRYDDIIENLEWSNINEIELAIRFTLDFPNSFNNYLISLEDNSSK